MLAAPKVGAPVKWVEDRRENLLAAGQVPPRARRRARWRSTPTARSRPSHIDFVVRLRRVPDARGRSCPRPPSACCSPARTACPRAGFAAKTDLHEHRRPHRVPRPVAVRVARPRGAARHRGPPDGHRPGRAAPPQPAAPRRAAVREPERHDLRQHLAARDVRAGARRCSTTTRSAPSRPRRARPAATSASGMSNYVEPSTPGFGAYAHRGGDDPHRAVGHGQRVHRRRLDREQHRDDRRPAHRRRARRRHRRRRHDPGRHRASPASAPGAAGSRSGSMTAGAVRETAAILRERIVAIAAHKLEAAVDDIELAEQPGERARHAVDRHLARRARRARLLRPAVAAARRARPGSRRARGTPRRRRRSG